MVTRLVCTYETKALGQDVHVIFAEDIDLSENVEDLPSKAADGDANVASTSITKDDNIEMFPSSDTEYG